MTVVFDGYSGETSNETEQRRRYGAEADQHKILFNLSMNVTSIGEDFLSNSSNKGRLIEALTVWFESAGIFLRQAEEDADLLIVQTAIDAALSKPASKVYIVGEDIDLLVKSGEVMDPGALNLLPISGVKMLNEHPEITVFLP